MVQLPSPPLVATNSWPSRSANDLLQSPKMYLPSHSAMAAAIDVAAGHRDALAALGLRRAVLVLEDRRDQARAVALAPGARSAARSRSSGWPPCAASRGWRRPRDDAHLLVAVLLHVAAEQLVVAAHVERAAPRVAQAVAPRSRAAPAASSTNGLSAGMPYVLPSVEPLTSIRSILPCRRGQVLAIALGHVVADAPVVGVAAVAGRDVEHSRRGRSRSSGRCG